MAVKKVSAGGQVVGDDTGLIQGPGLEGGDELRLVDQADLKREQPEEQVVVRADSRQGMGLPMINR